jgi:hypothetical protein
MAEGSWKALHIYYRDSIVPAIQDIHPDFYLRYDMWLHDPGTKLEKQTAENFAKLVHKIHENFIQDSAFRKCFSKVSPFI